MHFLFHPESDKKTVMTSDMIENINNYIWNMACFDAWM